MKRIVDAPMELVSLYQKTEEAKQTLELVVGKDWAPYLFCIARRYAKTMSGYTYQVVYQMVDMAAHGANPEEIERYYES